MSDSELTIFVYGTLKPGGAYWSEFCEGKLSSILAAKICGELYDLHLGYPGLRLIGDSWVQGYLLTYKNRADFNRVDELEGFEPDRPESDNEYNRVLVDCYTPTGHFLGRFWTYEVTRAVLGKVAATRIADGNWPVSGG